MHFANSSYCPLHLQCGYMHRIESCIILKEKHRYLCNEVCMLKNGGGNFGYCFPYSTLLKSPSVSVSLGTSMNSPGVQMRNMSATLLEPANTPVAFGKCGHFKGAPVPGSPGFSGPVGSTLHTSTPVALCKSALVHSNLEDSMHGSSLIPTNSDSTVNYAITSGPISPTGQNSSMVHLSTPVQPQKVYESQQQATHQSVHAKDDTKTGHSFISLPHLVHEKINFPGDPEPKESNENSVQGHTELASGIERKEASPVVCIEESPPNSQSNGTSVVKTDGDELLLSTKVAEQRSVGKRESQGGVSKTPDLRPVDSERPESPVLFDTPGCIGGPQSLAAKISSINNKQPISDHSNSNAALDDDKTPPISPTDSTTEDAELKIEQNETNDGNCQPCSGPQEDKNNLCAKSSCNVTTADYESPRKRSSSKRQCKRSSALGQPRTRRANTRMATRKSTAENSAYCSSKKDAAKTPGTNLKESVDNDEDDFVSDKRTPRKQATVAEPMDVQVRMRTVVQHVYMYVLMHQVVVSTLCPCPSL